MSNGYKRIESYNLHCQINKLQNEENRHFVSNPEDGASLHKVRKFGSLVAETFSMKQTTELLTVTDNYYKVQNNGTPPSFFLFFVWFYLFGS